MFTFRLNGKPITVSDDRASGTLLEFVRGRGLTGSKEGCAEGECGACAMAFVGPHPAGSEYRVFNSCLMLLPMAAGRDIYTIEALARHGTLTEAQRAMASAGGSQCGYCTPGFVMSLFAEQYRPGRSSACDLDALAGNLCRCTGYRPIRDAALSLGPAPDDEWRARLGDRPAPLGLITTPRFGRPVTLAACLDLLADDPQATVVAGGTDIGVDWNIRHRRFDRLVSLEGIDELREFVDGPDEVRIGAALPIADIGRRWTGPPRAVRDWLDVFASPLIRNRATLGGNLMTASPIGDGAPLLLALDAQVEVASRIHTRRVPLSAFFTSYRQTTTEPGEILTAIHIPKPFPSTLSFHKVSKRRLDDISTVAAGMSMSFDQRRRISRARFAFGGVAATPVVVAAAETAILGAPWDDAAVTAVQRVLADCLTPLTDHRGSREYRLSVALSLVEKFHAETRA